MAQFGMQVPKHTDYGMQVPKHTDYARMQVTEVQDNMDMDGREREMAPPLKVLSSSNCRCRAS